MMSSSCRTIRVELTSTGRVVGLGFYDPPTDNKHFQYNDESYIGIGIEGWYRDVYSGYTFEFYNYRIVEKYIENKTLFHCWTSCRLYSQPSIDTMFDTVIDMFKEVVSPTAGIALTAL